MEILCIFMFRGYIESILQVSGDDTKRTKRWYDMDLLSSQKTKRSQPARKPLEIPAVSRNMQHMIFVNLPKKHAFIATTIGEVFGGKPTVCDKPGTKLPASPDRFPEECF